MALEVFRVRMPYFAATIAGIVSEAWPQLELGGGSLCPFKLIVGKAHQKLHSTLMGSQYRPNVHSQLLKARQGFLSVAASLSATCTRDILHLFACLRIS